jgi:phage major head subunit gpT-like protein
MGIIEKSIVLEKGLRADFMKKYSNGEPVVGQQFIMETVSTSDSEKYGWLGNPPEMNEWKDERKVNGLASYSYSIPNKDFESTIGVSRNEILDDQIGGIKVRINDMATKARQQPWKLFINALIKGTTDLCFDGAAFFSTSHVLGTQAAQSNLLTGTGETVALVKADFIAARAAMKSFKDEQGAPINEGDGDLYVIAHPDMQGVFDELFKASMLSNTTNTLMGAAKCMFSSRLTDKDDWYLIDASGEIKPFIRQLRQAVEFGALEKDSDAGFMRKVFHYGCDIRVGFGYGIWAKAIKTTNT